MAQMIKIHTIALGELNNTEYTYFSQQVSGFAFSIAQPTKATAAFITSLNKLIDDTKTAYNQRLAQAHAAEKKQTK